jgi:hypothetical protein
MASFKAPGGQPRVIEAVAPHLEDLHEIATLSGKAIAACGPERSVPVVRAMVR